MKDLCVRCKGRGWCGGPCKILTRLKEFQPKVSYEFSGSSPPEIFVGHYGYPNVFSGILAPAEHGETEKFSMPEVWHEQKASIQDILAFRSRMIYSRFSSNIKSARSKQQTRLFDIMQEISLASKSVDASFKLKKKPRIKMQVDIQTPMIGNTAPLKSVRLESNLKVERKVDYLVNDTDVKSTIAIQELYKSNIAVSNIIKILSAGMLGLQIQRKLVPTRWAVTTTDDTISKSLLEKIRHYQEISSFLLFHASYLGNYYNIILMPGCWCFEVIEVSSKGYFGQQDRVAVWQDHEFFSGRKRYASSVTGAYYANRLAVCEYLERIKRQASVLVLREIRDEYWAPCGVGILREVTREAMSKKPEKFDTIEGALRAAQTKFKLPLEIYTKKSRLLQNIREQTSLKKFLKIRSKEPHYS